MTHKLVTITVRPNQIITLDDSTEILVKRRFNKGNRYLVVMKVPVKVDVEVTEREAINPKGLPGPSKKCSFCSSLVFKLCQHGNCRECGCKEHCYTWGD